MTDDPATRDPAEDDRRAMAQAIAEANGGAVGLGQLVNAFGAVAAARFDLGPAEELTDEGTRAVLDALVDVAKRRGWAGAVRVFEHVPPGAPGREEYLRQHGAGPGA